jgi:hypothetical protein
MTDTDSEELAREAFIDGFLQGVEIARRVLAGVGGTMDAPTFGCERASKTAYKRAKERIRRRNYPKLKAIKDRAR